MNTKAFTLIELIVVVSIIITISTSGVFYFADFIESQELKQKLTIVEENLNDLDKEADSYEIFDYEVILSTNTGTLGYITNKNIFDIEKNNMLDFDFSTGTGVLSIKNGTLSDLWILNIYKNKKLFLSASKNGNENYTQGFSDASEYKISSTLSGSTLNDIYINYFTESNLDIEAGNLIELTGINSKEDKSGTSYSTLSIKKIGKSKTIGNNESEIYLFFENRGKEDFIKIIK